MSYLQYMFEGSPDILSMEMQIAAKQALLPYVFKALFWSIHMHLECQWKQKKIWVFFNTKIVHTLSFLIIFR